jgi:hypothetical protein
MPDDRQRRKQAASAATTHSRPDLITIGPLGPIYIPPPGQPGPAGLLWHAAERAARRGGGWVIRHLLRATRRVRPGRPRPASGPARQGR